MKHTNLNSKSWLIPLIKIKKTYWLERFIYRSRRREEVVPAPRPSDNAELEIKIPVTPLEAKPNHNNSNQTNSFFILGDGMENWKNHFANNQRNRTEPKWDAPTELTDHQIETLLPSLAQFELGDGGGPCYLTAWNREKFLSQPNARELVDLWFKEEAEHSRLLGDAVKRFGREKIESHWSFSLFCLIRKLLGVNFELRTLTLTEIVSNVYYQMMLKHGGPKDPAIAQMCKLVIRDETGHIAFQKDRMARSGKRFGMIWAGIFNIMGLAAGTVLWVSHGKAIRALGGKNSEFYQEIWHAMDHFIITLRKRTQEKKTHRGEQLQMIQTIHQS